MLARTKQFGIKCGKLIESLHYNIINKNYSAQLIRSSSSVGANYRAALRAKSKADFINKFKIVEEELDESLYFLELILEFNPDQKQFISDLTTDGEVLLK